MAMGGDSLSILIRSMITPPSTAELLKIQEEIQKKIKPINFKVDASGVNQTNSGLKSISNGLDSASKSAKGFGNDLKTAFEKFPKMNGEIVA